MYDQLCIIIPCFNESANIGNVLRDLAEHLPGARPVVVNDCSHDNTAAVAEATGLADVISLPVNLGIGGAVQTGLKFAFNNGFRYAVKFDGDGQHKAEEIGKLLQPILDGDADVVIGSRFLDDCEGFKSTTLRRVGITVFMLVNSLIVGRKITDNTSGFRAYNAEALSFLADYYPSFDYPEPEEVVLLARNGFRLREVSTPMEARSGGVSSITAFRSAYYMIKVLLAIFMVAVRPRIRE